MYLVQIKIHYYVLLVTAHNISYSASYQIFPTLGL